MNGSLTSYPGFENGDDDEYIDTDVDEEVTLREVTDGGSDFEEANSISSDGGEGGDKDMFDSGSDEEIDGCSDEGMGYSGDESDYALFDLELK